MANAIGTGVNVPDFRHVAHHSLFDWYRNLIYLMDYNPQSMARITVSIQINSSVEEVWKVISDIDNEPKFWKGTKSVKNLSKDGDVINREIIIAFRDQKCLQEVKLYPKQKVEARFTKGILNGEKIITITPKDDTIVLETVWDIKLTGMMAVFTGMIKKHIKSGTEQAMNSIKKEIENFD